MQQVSLEHRQHLLGMITNAQTAQGGRVIAADQVSAVILKVNPVNHILHLLLAVFTCGLWLPVWIFEAWVRPRSHQFQVWVDEYGQAQSRPWPVRQQ